MFDCRDPRSGKFKGSAFNRSVLGALLAKSCLPANDMTGPWEFFETPSKVETLLILAGFFRGKSSIWAQMGHFLAVELTHDTKNPILKKLTTLTSNRKADWSWFNFYKQMVWESFLSVWDFPNPLRIVKTYRSQSCRVKSTLATYSEFPMLLCKFPQF